MSTQPFLSSYRQPLKINALLVLLLVAAYGLLRLQDVDYGAGIHHPELGAVLIFLLTFCAFPLVNFLFFLRSYKRRSGEARVYGLLSVIFFIGAYWIGWQALHSLGKVNGG